MFGELLESRPRRTRNRAGVVVSIVGHALVIATAVVATRTQLTARVPDERIVPLPVFPAPPQPAVGAPTPTTSPVHRRPAPSLPVPIVIPPLDIPIGIPPVDVRHDIPMPDAGDWRPLSPGASTRGGVALGSGSGDDGRIHIASGVDKPALALSDNPTPRYPDVLRRNGVHGEVTIEIVVDTTGRAEMESLRVIASNHPLLSDAVRSALAQARYLPAEAGGRKVRMWIRQSFLFEVR